MTFAYARGGPRYRISVERRSGTTLAVLFVAAMTVATAACASVAPSASLTPVSIAIPPSSSAAAPSPVPTAGGCGETVVYAPPGPDSAGRGLDAQPWAPASPRSAGVLAYLWGQPPVFLHVDPPVGTSNKVLWDTRGDIGDHLEIVAHLNSQPSPTLPVTFDVPATGYSFPSLIDLPKPGCWHLDLRTGSVSASIDLLVAS